jgi:lipopolysaccharide biosynthesis glycosyltransferase
MDGPMHVALAADEGYFPGLACAILSIALAADRARGIEFHVMDGGIADASWDSLTGKLAALDPAIRLHRVSIALAAFDGLPAAACGGPMTYARLLMETMIPAEQVIYVDSDFLCFRNLRDLWDVPMGDDLIAACQDRGVQRLGDDPVLEWSPEDAQRPYFNAGFLKANLQAWRREGVQAQTLALLRDHGARCLWWDQTALNAICKGRVQWLDPSFNQYYVKEVAPADLAEGRVNIHYAARTKPWQTPSGKVITNVIWLIFYQRRIGGGNIRGSTAIFNRCGAPLLALINLLLAGLAILTLQDTYPGHLLERRKSRIQLIQWAWKRSQGA